MYGLPKDISVTFFHERTLLQLCIGVHDLILNFDNEIRITVTSAVALVDSTNTVQRSDDFRAVVTNLVRLLNQKVVSAQGDESGTLTLGFDNGQVLAIYDDSKEYESYTIKNGAQNIIV